MIKILLVGCGYWGKNWYNTIKTSDYELVGVVDPNPVIDVDVPLFNDVDDVDVEYDRAIIATNAELHSTIKEKLKCDNILVEKPCGTDENRHELEDCFPGYIFLSSPQYKFVKDKIDSGQLGKILYSKFQRASMGPRLRTDVSILEDYLIHDLYLYEGLFENINSSGYGLSTTVINHFDSPIQSDTIFVDIDNNGHRASFFSSWIYPEKLRRIEIIGDQGSIIWQDDEVFYSNSRYEKINGNDHYNNVGYKLIEEAPLSFKGQFKSNLHLQLDDFINQVDRSKIFKSTNSLIENIKLSIDN